MNDNFLCEVMEDRMNALCVSCTPDISNIVDLNIIKTEQVDDDLLNEESCGENLELEQIFIKEEVNYLEETDNTCSHSKNLSNDLEIKEESEVYNTREDIGFTTKDEKPTKENYFEETKKGSLHLNNLFENNEEETKEELEVFNMREDIEITTEDMKLEELKTDKSDVQTSLPGNINGNSEQPSLQVQESKADECVQSCSRIPPPCENQVDFTDPPILKVQAYARNYLRSKRKRPLSPPTILDTTENPEQDKTQENMEKKIKTVNGKQLTRTENRKTPELSLNKLATKPVAKQICRCQFEQELVNYLLKPDTISVDFTTKQLWALANEFRRRNKISQVFWRNHKEVKMWFYYFMKKNKERLSSLKLKGSSEVIASNPQRETSNTFSPSSTDILKQLSTHDPAGARVEHQDKAAVEKVVEIVEQCLLVDGLSKNVEKSKKNVSILVNDHSSSNVFIDITTGYKLTVYDRRHSCLFCSKRFVNMRRHFEKAHLKKNEIESIQDLPLKAEKIQSYIRLTRVGDFLHNARVLLNDTDELIVLRPSEKYIYTQIERKEFVPCPDCAGFVHKSRLKIHHRKCSMIISSEAPIKNRNLFKESHTLLAYLYTQQIEAYFEENISNRFCNTFGEAAKHDPVIKLLGQHLASKMKSSDDDHHFVKKTMQKMGCLLLLCRNESGQVKLSFSKLLVPEHIKILFTSIKTFLGSWNMNFEMKESLFSVIVTCVFLWRGKCLIERNLPGAELVLRFYYIFAESWEREIGITGTSGKVGSEINQNSFYIISPVINLKNILALKMRELTNILKYPSSNDDITSLWFDLAEIVICLLCLFNNVEFSLIEALQITEYAVRPDWCADSLSDYKNKLSYINYYLAAKRFIVSRKHNGRDVFILFTAEIKKAIDVLITTRTLASVSTNNVYVFAEQNSDRNNPLKAINCFYNLCINNGMLEDNVLRNKSKRQFISYVTQISDMSPEEKEGVKVYLGKLSSEHHRSLDSFSRALKSHEVNQIFEESNNGLEKDIMNSQLNQSVSSNPPNSTIIIQTLTLPHNPVKIQLARLNTDPRDPMEIQPKKNPAREAEFTLKKSNINLGQRDTHPGKNHRRMNSDKGARQVRKKLNFMEREFVLNYFREEIKNQVIPSTQKCMECLWNGGDVLHGRSWLSIKSFVKDVFDIKKTIYERNNPLFCDL